MLNRIQFFGVCLKDKQYVGIRNFFLEFISDNIVQDNGIRRKYNYLQTLTTSTPSPIDYTER